MIQITKNIEWNMGHRIPNHRSKCWNPHGHRYRLELSLSGDLIDVEGDSSEGMVFDFADIKAIMIEKIYNPLDHGFMIYEGDEIMRTFFESDPAAGFLVIKVPFIPTVENIAKWCYQQIHDCFPKGIHVSNCRVFETPNSWTDYHPG